tara:strand:- start:186 stop:560 length:375 start_codon:yes stop_codon:yes gene_type:complete
MSRLFYTTFLIIFVAQLNGGFFKNLNSVDNPNGKPGLLTISYNMGTLSPEAVLPIANFLTISFDYSLARGDWLYLLKSWGVKARYFEETESLLIDYDELEGVRYWEEVFNTKISCHIPLYKLWE